MNKGKFWAIRALVIIGIALTLVACGPENAATSSATQAPTEQTTTPSAQPPHTPGTPGASGAGPAVSRRVPPRR